jgi:FADH2 O2-dependent halogenase
MDRELHTDVIIIGGGPAGATLGGLLGMEGHKALILENDIHPRDHVGESLVPGNNFVLNRLGFLPKMEQAGFIHKEGVGWTAPESRLWNLVAIKTSDFPAPNAVQTYSYNVDREWFDAMLLRHAHELGAKVLEGAQVKRVLFEGDRAIGVRVSVAGYEKDLYSKFVVDASGRRCLLGTQLGLKRKDAQFNQFCIWSWFSGVGDPPPGHEGMVIFHFLGLERAWAWQIPIRDGATSVGIVTDKVDFTKSGRSHEEFFESLVARNKTFKHAMAGAERTRDWVIEGDYSYRMDKIAGPGWIMIGDAFRFVDPIFSSGVDVALNSAQFAHDAILKTWEGSDEEQTLEEYSTKVTNGVDVWYETTRLFYKLQSLFGRFALDRRYREAIARSLQGNPYNPVNQERSKWILAIMEEAYEEVIDDPNNLLRPGTWKQLREEAVKLTEAAS